MQMHFLCVKMIRNTVYKMFIVIFAVMILYNLQTLYIWYIYNLHGIPHHAVILTKLLMYGIN